MHLLDMVLASVNIYDAISVSLRKDGTVNIKINDKSIPEGDNSVTKAVNAAKKRIGSLGADITVKKNIPIAAGLGGSSADAAGVILALDKLLNLSEKGINIKEIAAETGSDTVYMLEGGYKRITGIGNSIETINSDAVLHLVLASPNKGCLTPAVYTEFDNTYPSYAYLPSENEQLISSLISGDVAVLTASIGNALYEPASKLCPEIKDVYEKVSALCPAVMTGSGSFIVGICGSDEEAKANAKKLRKAGYFAIAVETLNKGYEIN